MASIRRVLAQNIRALATEKKLTLNRVADFADISRAQLFHVLAGTRGATIDLLEKLAGALDVEPWELLVPRRKK